MDDSLTTDGMEGMAPRTPRCGRLWAALGRRLGLSLGLLVFAALSARWGGPSSSCKAPARTARRVLR